MHDDHTKLDRAVEDLAERFDVPLPDEPASPHRGWMAEISGKSGEDFDRAFATRLRAAHGSVFSTIAEVRAGTKNETILEFATQANNIVLKHMTLLEATGYVNADTGHFAEAATRTAASPENRLGAADVLLGIVVFLAVGLVTALAVRLLSARGSAN
jgi:putative membrane protein